MGGWGGGVGGGMGYRYHIELFETNPTNESFFMQPMGKPAGGYRIESHYKKNTRSTNTEPHYDLSKKTQLKHETIIFLNEQICNSKRKKRQGGGGGWWSIAELENNEP